VVFPVLAEGFLLHHKALGGILRVGTIGLQAKTIGMRVFLSEMTGLILRAWVKSSNL
jgi:hypothetical protein